MRLIHTPDPDGDGDTLDIVLDDRAPAEPGSGARGQKHFIFSRRSPAR